MSASEFMSDLLFNHRRKPYIAQKKKKEKKRAHYIK